MLRGLWKLTWLEIKIFLREPLGAFGSIILPVLVFVVISRLLGGSRMPNTIAASRFISVELPVFVAVLIALSGVLSLVTIISIYREGGILRRLRATPLRPQTILTAHVLVKLALTVVTLALMVLAGKRYYPLHVDVPIFQLWNRATDQHVEHPVDRFSDREHCAYGAFRATGGRGHSLSDAWLLRAVRAGAFAASRASNRGASRFR